MRLKTGFLLLIPLLFAAACSSLKKNSSATTESVRFNKFLDESFEEFINESPEFLTAIGQKKFYDRLNDYSEGFDIKMKAFAEAKLLALQGFKYDQLDTQTRLSYDLFKKQAQDTIADFLWKDYTYPFNQQYGMHTELPTFMMNMHQVDSEQDARAYIARLVEFRRVFREVIEQVKRSEKARVVPPKFVYPYVISAAKNIIKGRPFDASNADSPLYADFKKKLEKLKLGEEKNKELTTLAEKALIENVGPAYKDVLQVLAAQQKRAKTTAGVWKFPNGSEFYRTKVQRHTTTALTPDEIHNLGLKNVERIHNEMKAVLKQMNYKGSLQSYFKHLRDGKEFYYPNTDAGRKAYMDASNGFYKNINKRIPEFFRLMPKAQFEIRAVEKFREDSAGIAFYDPPSEDGSRPGVYYVNLKDMHNLPKHEAEAILYHEGAPGHHFQIALAQEMTNMPKYRRYSHYTAFIEGWGLYTEHLAKEMGAYQDPISEFGRLSTELLRAARLVVDSGLHAKRWTREKAIKYFQDNLPGALDDQKNEIERYIVMPGQATAYMVGKLKIEELRAMAQEKLATQFDYRDFHDVVLGSGAMPLNALEARVKAYVDDKLTATANPKTKN